MLSQMVEEPDPKLSFSNTVEVNMASPKSMGAKSSVRRTKRPSHHKIGGVLERRPGGRRHPKIPSRAPAAEEWRDGELFRDFFSSFELMRHGHLFA